MAKTKAEQQQRVINFEDFELIKIKLKAYGLDVMWSERGKTDKTLKEVKVEPHPDLTESLDNLIPYFADRLGINEGLKEFKKGIDKKELAALEAIQDTMLNQVDRCSVSGVSISGEGPLKKVIITGKVKTPVYGSYSLGCPGINLESEKLGYEQEVIELLEPIKKEAYNLLFNGKVAPKKPNPQTEIPMD